MRWRDVCEVHNGMQAKVWASSTPRHPLSGEGPYIGYIQCPTPDSVPLLFVWNGREEVHHFAWYWEVDLIQGIYWGDYKGDPANY